MSDQRSEAIDTFHGEAAAWDRDRLEALTRSRRLAWWVAGSATSVSLLLALAMMLLMPLRTVVPFTLLVDRNSGYVQAMKPLDRDMAMPDAALTRSFLVQYVIARESYDADIVKSNYDKVALWSAETARADYVKLMQLSNPLSPLNLYPRTTVVETQVKTVSRVSRVAALIRFDTIRRDASGVAQPSRSWVAVIRYRYSGEPMKLEDRFVNPLGFQVVRYRKDPESASPQTAPPVTSAVAATSVVASPSTTNVTVVTPGPLPPPNGPRGTGAFVPPASDASPLAPAARAAGQRAQQRRAAEPPL